VKKGFHKIDVNKEILEKLLNTTSGV